MEATGWAAAVIDRLMPLGAGHVADRALFLLLAIFITFLCQWTRVAMEFMGVCCYRQ